MAGAARDDRAAARERAGAPVELARVAGDDVHVLDVTPSASATICANDVKCPCPCVPTPVATRTVPLGSTVTRAPSYGPMPVPST